MTGKPALTGPTAQAFLGQIAAFLSQKQQEGLIPPTLTDLLNANSLFQLVSLAKGRTPYSQVTLLTYTAHMLRKTVLGWAQGCQRRSPGTQLPSECHLVQIPYDKI